MKLSKAQRKQHDAAMNLLEKDRLTDTDIEFFLANFHEGASGDVGTAGAFFRPPDLANDFAIDVSGPKIVDLCAGIGTLSILSLWHRRYDDNPPDITCVERNPYYGFFPTKVRNVPFSLIMLKHSIKYQSVMV